VDKIFKGAKPGDLPIYVDRILKGAKPGDLPVEQPMRFEMMANMKTAKALGIKLSNSMLVQTTRMIE
jgi:putative ABC transport system substrate-binding protein